MTLGQCLAEIPSHCALPLFVKGGQGEFAQVAPNVRCTNVLGSDLDIERFTAATLGATDMPVLDQQNCSSFKEFSYV